MDLALLAVTALGFVGVFLMLPRERATVSRIGGLIGVLALGGLFLLLVRQSASAPPTAGGPSIFFYVFASIMVLGAAGVISQPRPVYAALYFVLVTLAGAALFVLLMSEFMAIVLVIVYAGAILVTYVFVLMLASQGNESHQPPEYDRRASEPFWAVLVSFVLLGTILQVLYPEAQSRDALAGKPKLTILAAASQKSPDLGIFHGSANAMMVDSQAEVSTAPATEVLPPRPGNMQLLGVTLYGSHAFALELAGILLTIALVGAVMIARKNVDYEDKPAVTGALPSE